MSENSCKVKLTGGTVKTFLEEGKHCGVCRRNFNDILSILERISGGTAAPDDLVTIEDSAHRVANMCQCGRGKPVVETVLRHLREYRDDFLVHIENRVCPSGECPKLTLAPCQAACPAGISIPNYIALAGMGKYAEALALIREDVPLPGSLGRICEHPCERACRRAEVDRAISICALKRLAYDKTGEGRALPPAAPASKYTEQVAVIGAGPAGLSAAYFLARRGYGVTVFEAMPEPGGMLSYGIPPYRLPRQVLRDEIARIQALGVEIRLNTPVRGENSLHALREKGYAAVFLGTGAWQGSVPVANPEGLAGVMDGITFLRNVNGELNSSGTPGTDLNGKTIIVVGGGNVAIDAARVAKRLGAREVRLVYRRTREEMPALAEEIVDAEKENVTFDFLVSPVRFAGQNGRVTHLVCLRNELSRPDAGGRRKPVPVENSEFNIEADLIIFATGQQPELSFLAGEGGTTAVETNRNRITVNPGTLETSLPGVFAGGDAVTGPASAIKAMAAGKQAAAAIHAYLRGQVLAAGIKYPVKRESIPPAPVSAAQRACPGEIDLHHLYDSGKQDTFEEIMEHISEQAARAEAARCLRCDICTACGRCADTCSHQVGADAIRLGYAGDTETDFHRPGEKCMGCGTCSISCPTGAITLEDKDGYREMRMAGGLMSRLPLATCRVCGQPFATGKHLDYINAQLPPGQPRQDRDICPDCARQTWSQKVFGGRTI